MNNCQPDCWDHGQMTFQAAIMRVEQTVCNASKYRTLLSFFYCLPLYVFGGEGLRLCDSVVWGTCFGLGGTVLPRL